MGQNAGSTPQCRLLQKRELFGLQPVPRFVPPNSLCLSENRTFTSNNSSGGPTRGSRPPLLGAELVFRVQCKSKVCTAARNPALDPLQHFPFIPALLRCPAILPACSLGCTRSFHLHPELACSGWRATPPAADGPAVFQLSQAQWQSCFSSARSYRWQKFPALSRGKL